MVALPFCHLSFSHKIQPLNYPKEIKTLGDHLLARRLDKKLYQKDVGEILGVDGNTILNWEKNYTDPEVKYYPKIMEFFKYCPIHFAQNFGELLLLHRTHRGLSLRALAEFLQVDPGSISRWETGGREPWRKWKNRIIKFFDMQHHSFKTK